MNRPPLTKAEVDERREKAIAFIAHIQKKPIEEVGARIKFTCDECKNPEDCEWAFDAYNTDGDCLDMK